MEKFITEQFLKKYFTIHIDRNASKLVVKKVASRRLSQMLVE